MGEVLKIHINNMKKLTRDSLIPGNGLTYAEKLKKSKIKPKKIKSIKEVAPGYFKIEHEEKKPKKKVK